MDERNMRGAVRTSRQLLSVPLSADAVLAYERELRLAFYGSRGRALSWDDRDAIRPHRSSTVRLTAQEKRLEQRANKLLTRAGCRIVRGVLVG